LLAVDHDLSTAPEGKPEEHDGDAGEGGALHGDVTIRGSSVDGHSDSKFSV
jgi:hypothetical protein